MLNSGTAALQECFSSATMYVNIMSRAAAKQMPTGNEQTGRKFLLPPGLLSTCHKDTRFAGIR